MKPKIDIQPGAGSKPKRQLQNSIEPVWQPDGVVNPQHQGHSANKPMDAISQHYGLARQHRSGGRNNRAANDQLADTIRQSGITGLDGRGQSIEHQRRDSNVGQSDARKFGPTPVLNSTGRSNPLYTGPKKQIFDFVLRQLLNPKPGAN